MYSKTISTVAVALAASGIASAQTFTDCNPLQKTCPPNPAFGKNKVTCDFTSGKCKAFHDLAGTTISYDNSMGAVFSVDRPTHAPTIRTDNYLFFGRIDVEIQAAPEGGIVTSAVLQSDDLDEIDFEWVGNDDKQVQSNYFSKGDDSTFDRGAYHAVDSPITKFHTYTIDWTPDYIKWIINGQTLRTLNAADVGDKFPQSPMQVRLGAWTAGKDGAPQGTIDWSGGIADFSKGPFNAYYKSITIVDYAGGSSASSKDVKEYVYGDKSGSAKSIQVKLQDGSSGNSDDNDDKTTKSESKTSSAAATTKTSSKSSQVQTTMTTASSSKAAESTSVPASINSTTTSAPTTAATSAPPTVPTGSGETGAAAHNGMAVGSIIVGAFVVAAQLI